MASQTSVIIVNWNGAEFLDRLIRSISGCKPHQIIVVDNASTDGSQEMLSRHPNLQIIQNADNLGFGRAANQGIALSSAPYIMLLNADIEVLPGSINKLQKFLEENPQAAAAAPQLIFPNGGIQRSCRRFPTVGTIFLYLSFLDHLFPTRYRLSKKLHQELREVDQPMGAALLLRKKVLDEVGPFDEEYFLYMEDVDLCQRIKSSGHQIFLFPEARMIHFAGGSSKFDWERSQANYFQSLIHYFQKRTSSGFKMVIVKLSFAIALLIRSLVLFIGGKWKAARFYTRMAFTLFQLS